MSKALPAERVNGEDPVRSDPAQDLIAIINELLFRNAARFQPPNLDQPVWFKFDDLSLLPQVVQRAGKGANVRQLFTELVQICNIVFREQLCKILCCVGIASADDIS